MVPDGLGRDAVLRLAGLTLHFENNEPIRTLAVVIRPNGRAF